MHSTNFWKIQKWAQDMFLSPPQHMIVFCLLILSFSLSWGWGVTDWVVDGLTSTPILLEISSTGRSHPRPQWVSQACTGKLWVWETLLQQQQKKRVEEQSKILDSTFRSLSTLHTGTYMHVCSPMHVNMHTRTNMKNRREKGDEHRHIDFSLLKIMFKEYTKWLVL